VSSLTNAKKKKVKWIQMETNHQNNVKSYQYNYTISFLRILQCIKIYFYTVNVTLMILKFLIDK